MTKLKKILAGASLALAVGAAVVVPAVNEPAPSNSQAKLTSCRSWTETVKKPGCDYKKYICEAYIYHKICD